MAQKIDRSTQAQTKTNSNPAENSHTNSKTQQEPSPRLPGQLHRPRPKSQPDKTKIKRPTKYKQIKKETQIIVLLEFFIIIIHGYLILFSLQLPLLSLTLKTTQNPTTPANSFSDPQPHRWFGLTCGPGRPTHFIFFTFFIVLCDMSLSDLFQHSLHFSSAYNVQVIVDDNEPKERLLGRFRREVIKVSNFHFSFLFSHFLKGQTVQSGEYKKKKKRLKLENY